jgi:hypothetical protein
MVFNPFSDLSRMLLAKLYRHPPNCGGPGGSTVRAFDDFH